MHGQQVAILEVELSVPAGRLTEPGVVDETSRKEVFIEIRAVDGKLALGNSDLRPAKKARTRSRCASLPSIRTTPSGAEDPQGLRKPPA